MTETIAGKYVLLPEPPRLGGFASVRKAFDVSEQTFAAVKLVGRDKNPHRELAFIREMESLQTLSHPNIIRLRDAGIHEESDAYFLALDWVEGNLKEILNDKGPYEWEDLADQVAVPLVEALAYAHLKEVEHRDIKPANVLVTETGTPLLADFGIAKVQQGSVSDHTVMGFRSGVYCPPEEDGLVKNVRDVYSMGVLLIQAMHQDRIGNFQDIDPALQAINVPPDVRKLLARCVHPDAAERPANGAFLADELRNALAGRAVLPVASRSRVWLKLTHTARQHLLEHAPSPGMTAEAVMQDDLSEDAFAEYRYDPTKQSVDLSTVFLVGKQWKFTLKLDSPPALVVKSARPREYEDLERFRKFAMSVGNFVTWDCAEPRNRVQAENGRHDLLRALDDFEEEKEARRYPDPETGEGPDILDEWSKVLQAREDLARSALKTIPYTNRHIRDREVDLTLRDPVEEDLVGTDWEVLAGDSRKVLVYGKIVGQENNVLTLRSKTSIWPRMAQKGTVRPSLGPTRKALQRQRDAISAFRDGTAARPNLRYKIQDPSKVTVPVPQKVAPEAWSRTLDTGKKQAIESALGMSDILLVEGPPGTGKTDLIAEIVYQSLRERPNSRILIVSQTHVAVDNALARLDDAGISGIVRLGHPDDPRVDKSVQHLLLNQRMAKWAEGISRKALRYLERVASEHGLDARHLNAALSLKQIAEVIRDREEVRAEIDRRVNSSGATSNLATALEIVEDDSDLQERVDELAVRYEQLYEEVVTLLAGDLTLAPSLTETDARAAADVLLGPSASAQKLLDLVGLQAEWLKRTRTDRHLADAFLGTAQVIAGTCIGFVGHTSARELDIDLCILDEASKATATEALVPLSRSRRAILVGDTNQLPPQEEDLLRSADVMAEHGIDRDLVQETLFKWFSSRLPEHSKFLLRDQYRMIRPIGDMVSTCFYGGELSSPRSDGLPGYDKLGKPVLWLDTSRLGESRREFQGHDGISYANREEVRIVFQRLQTLENAIKKGFVGTISDDEKLEVLLIAPYRRQVEDMQRRLSSTRFDYLQVDVLSVDAVQGRQCDIAIFSVTRSNPKLRLGFLGRDDWRRINVAMSRARFGLTIVGDAEFCRSAPGALQDIVRYMEAHSEDCEIQVVGNG